MRTGPIVHQLNEVAQHQWQWPALFVNARNDFTLSLIDAQRLSKIHEKRISWTAQKDRRQHHNQTFASFGYHSENRFVFE